MFHPLQEDYPFCLWSHLCPGTGCTYRHSSCLSRPCLGTYYPCGEKRHPTGILVEFRSSCTKLPKLPFTPWHSTIPDHAGLTFPDLTRLSLTDVSEAYLHTGCENCFLVPHQSPLGKNLWLFSWGLAPVTRAWKFIELMFSKSSRQPRSHSGVGLLFHLLWPLTLAPTGHLPNHLPVLKSFSQGLLPGDPARGTEGSKLFKRGHSDETT